MGSDGLLDPADLERELDERTLLVSVMAVNNEIGVLQPLAQISGLCRAAGALFHTDATQAAGRMKIDVDAWAVDLLSFSSHKVYGPKGIGTPVRAIRGVYQAAHHRRGTGMRASSRHRANATRRRLWGSMPPS